MGKVDVVIRNARLIDGTGAPSRTGDLAVTGDRISAMGGTLAVSAEREIDAQGKVLAPGFIDAHTHDDRIVLVDPGMACKVSQGVTTVVTGNCGISIAPVTVPSRPPAPLDLICPEPQHFFASFADYFTALDKAPPALNVVAQAGHSSLRVMAMDRLDRPATAAEIETMRKTLRQALQEGAAGLSTGLFYPPAVSAPTEEVEALAEVVHEFSGFHSTHMRDEGEGVLESLAESFRIGRTAKIPVVISHHKCTGTENHGRSVSTLAAIEAARRSQPIGLDAYPYIASSTILKKDRVGSATRTLVTWSTQRPDLSGRDLADIAAELGVSPEEAVDQLSPAGAIYFMMSEDDVQRILKYPATMIGSDGLPHDAHPHPRLWGTFPRVLGHYARDVGLFPLEEAVRKMTSLTARTFGIKDRGVLAEGAFADLVLFDAGAIEDSATFEQPTTPAAGIVTVLVNGKAVWEAGRATGARSGRGLRREQLTPLAFAS
ncbi:MAG: D-aminoacylase [Hyphomicrobiaceae bacterium]|nr:D-aminoacylase [Hyphomicrobiaceae bacterium]